VAWGIIMNEKNSLKNLSNIVNKIISSLSFGTKRSIKFRLILTFTLIIAFISAIAILPIYLFQKPINQYDTMFRNTAIFNDIIKSTNETITQVNIYSRVRYPIFI
jgi:hypothetical protein